MLRGCRGASSLLPLRSLDGQDEKRQCRTSLDLSSDSALLPTLSDLTAAPGPVGDACSDAMVSVGAAGRGGTGSFISADGLIITNHHVALDAVRQVSTEDHDYLKEGFVARDRSEEIKGPDYEVHPILTPW